MAQFYQAPGVYSEEIDAYQVIEGLSTSIASCVFASSKGPVNEPVFLSGREEFIRLFGEPRPAISKAHDCVIDFFEDGKNGWFLRVDNGSKYANLSFHNSLNHNEGLVGQSTSAYDAGYSDAQITYAYDPGIGSDDGYEGAGYDIIMLDFPGVLVASNVTTLIYNIGDGNANVTVTTTYASSSAASITAFAVALQASLRTNLGNNTITCTVLAGSTANRSLIRVWLPEGVEKPTVVSFAVTLGAGQIAVAAYVEPRLFDVFAISPGADGNTVGVRITKPNIGRPNLWRLTFSTKLITANVVNISVDGTAIDPVTYATSHANTMDLLLTELRATLNPIGLEAKFTDQPLDRDLQEDATEATLEIDIFDTGHLDGHEIVIDSAVVTLGSTQATITSAEVVEAEAWTGEFSLEVYLSDRPTVIVESWVVTLHEAVNGLGKQTNIMQVVNEGPNKSQYIRIYQPDYTRYRSEEDPAYNVRFGSTYSGNSYSTLVVSSAVQWLKNGSTVTGVTNSQVIAGWNSLSNKERYPLRMMINGGYSDPEIQYSMDALAKQRRDCMAILDMPPEYQEVQKAVEYRDRVLNINSSFSAIYTPDVKNVSQYNSIGRYTPPSGKMASIYARTDYTRGTWYAPAGLNRGILNNVSGLYKEYEQGDLEIFTPKGINAIIRKNGRGYVAWGDRTLQSKFSPLSYINIRRLLIFIQESIISALDFSVFEQNAAFAQFTIKQMINSFLIPLREQEALKLFLVVCDGRNNKQSDEEQGLLNVDLYLVPVYPVEKIRLRTIITREGDISFFESVG